jgi:hypothetical protein
MSLLRARVDTKSHGSGRNRSDLAPDTISLSYLFRIVRRIDKIKADLSSQVANGCCC